MIPDIHRLMTPAMTIAMILFIAGISTFAVFDAAQWKEKTDKMRADGKAAEELWMRECAGMNRAIDDCAKSWDRGGTLQRVYVRKLSERRSDLSE